MNIDNQIVILVFGLWLLDLLSNLRC